MIDWNKIPKGTKVYACDEWEDDWIEGILISYDENKRKLRFTVQYEEIDDGYFYTVTENFNYCSLEKEDE